ncbi:metalloregulator ArsR/SmtB family transcription factor [Mesorhizobium sp. B2-6-2]|uniref:ArsR/SmtB family transcription factor n=1 Tax=Mesorhizobium sp. B2-6-2 TaxID=2589915 RepID=UPI00112CD931|nr:metalloregulator ArsR/SmtB family transcription factor [Mesorhizobium sp. B2-6-2]TPJ76309.1 metalloregulator ArsR/SmtB family transcription factor [Mesorhizobium sp. B2-6-2]
MIKGKLRQERFSDLADLARVLGHAHRLVLLEHIAQGERSVERLAELAGLSIANASQHLQSLRRAGLVQTRRDGNHVLYRLGDGPLEAVLAGLRAYAHYQRREIWQLAADPENADGKSDSISREELLERLAEGAVTLLDVRPHEEYTLGHLPGSLNIPVDQLKERLSELPRRKEIVAYCRGPYCVLSSEAASFLKAKGFRVRRLDAGFPDWRAAGLAVEVAD